MTNEERAARHERLAAYIAAQPPENFKQSDWFCGTAACIGGHCAVMLGWEPMDFMGNVIHGQYTSFARSVAKSFLGYTDDLPYLFDPEARWQTRDAAVAELRRRAKAIERGEAV